MLMRLCPFHQLHDLHALKDPILFCLAADLGSKTVGEWPKDGWVKGWRTIDAS